MMILPSSGRCCCTWNQIRSPMAEGILKRFDGAHVFVDSAGVREGELDALMVEVMAEIGVDMLKHNPKSFVGLANESFDLVVALSPMAHAAAKELTRYMHSDLRQWSIQDPSQIEGSRSARLAAYRATRDQIQQKILDLFPRMD